ncbi:MAG: cytochrome b N-terminal domain-containing protein [Syntrophales bacterium]|jgi:ubiquinol-cytochrome c reductase cytochrome b subunit
MFSRIFKWIDERWPLTPFIRLALEEEMSGGAGYAYVFGSAALIIFLLQVVTGIWQLFYYVPTLGQGYNSLNYLRTEVPFGWLIHGFHYWGANAMVVLVMLHMSQVFIWGAYKKPHELQWITGVFMFLLTMAMSLTGGALPWDKRSYWLVEVAASTAGTVPVIGDVIKRIMLGGGVIGQLTLSRFFILHVALLSGGLMTLAAIHLIALRNVGNAGPWEEQAREKKGPFWPDQVFKDGLVASLIIFFLVALSVYAPSPFTGMADPLDASYIPKPEWNFLFFYEALKFLPGRLEIIATVGIPAVGTLILLLIPFVDRDPERHPLKRPLAMAGWVIVVAGFVALTLAGAYSKPEGVEAVVKTPAPPTAAAPAVVSTDEKAGMDLYKTNGCAACHRIGGTGGSIGPDLSGEGGKGRSREWLGDHLRNPKAHAPATVMPSFAALGDKAINQLVDYLLSLKGQESATASASAVAAAAGGRAQVASSGQGPQEAGRAITIIGSAEHGAIIFAGTCSSCHGPQGTGGVANAGSKDGTIPPLNPIDRDEFSPDPKAFAEKIDRYIQHGSRPEGPNPQVNMLPFGDNNALTQEQIADLEAYILSLNGVDRAAINHPGISPGMFFIIAAFAFLLVGINLLGWWWFWGLGRRRRKEVDK